MLANPLTQAIRLCQFASAYGELVPPTGEVDEFRAPKTRSCSPTRRARPTRLEEILLETGDEQVVVFAESKQLINLCHDRLVEGRREEGRPDVRVEVGLVTGDVPDYQRAENVRLFQNGEMKAILLTLAAGGEGLTLTAASTASSCSARGQPCRTRRPRIASTASARGRVGEHHRRGDRGHHRGSRPRGAANKAGMLEEITRDGQTMKEWLAK
jgi:ATP-dependent helicase YprA (DUF1998 family)